MADDIVASIKEERKKRKKSVPATIDDMEVAGRDKDQQGKLLFVHYDPEKTSRLLGTLENMRCLLNYYGIIIRYNVISKRIFFSIPGESFSVENGEDAAFACVFSFMKEWKLPVDGYQPYLMRIADENQYNPVMEWITSKPWDGRSRLQDFYDTVTSTEKEAMELLVRRWLITALCMAKGEGVDSAGCLVLQGPQDIGKTWWVKRLVPERLRKELIRTSASVDPHDKDSVSQIISYWIVELGEIDATFRRSDLQALKAFITSDEDTMRRPYGIGDKKYPRRTALVASVDQTIYLNDSAGNRRFWTIPCTAINSYHDIDMQQLFAEVLDLIENHGETWQLAPDEKAHIARINEEHMQIDPIYELLLDRYSWCTENQDYKSATTIATDLGLKNVTQKETRSITSYVLKLGGKRETGGAKRLHIPYVRL